MTTGFMMGLPNTSVAVVAATDGGLLYDPNAGNVYGFAITSGPQNGIRKWNGYPTGDELRARNAGDIGVSAGQFYSVHCLTYAAQQIVMSGGAANSQALLAFAIPDMTAAPGFGTTSASLAPSDAGRILASSYLVSYLDAKGRDVVVASTIAVTHEINCIQWGKKQNQRSTITENNALLGAVPDGSGNNAWALGYSLGTNPMHLYRIGPVAGGNGIQATVGTITVANIDPTWTNITTLYGLAVDQKDGNLLAGFQTGDAVAHQYYLVKINSTTAAIMWKIPITDGFPYASDRGAMRHSVIKNGQFYLIGGDGTVNIVDTIAGTVNTSLSIFGSGPSAGAGTQISEDVSGSVMWYGGWTEIGLHPAYIGTYNAAAGGSNMVWRFWPALGGLYPAGPRRCGVQPQARLGFRSGRPHLLCDGPGQGRHVSL
jgi:hypothetical protein